MRPLTTAFLLLLALLSLSLSIVYAATDTPSLRATASTTTEQGSGAWAAIAPSLAALQPVSNYTLEAPDDVDKQIYMCCGPNCAIYRCFWPRACCGPPPPYGGCC